jgi:preprotein translocase subunit SecE
VISLNQNQMAIKQYIKETAAEMKHVTWPTRRQTIVYGILVVAISLFVSAYLGLLDSVFASGIRMLIPSLN